MSRSYHELRDKMSSKARAKAKLKSKKMKKQMILQHSKMSRKFNQNISHLDEFSFEDS